MSRSSRDCPDSSNSVLTSEVCILIGLQTAWAKRNQDRKVREDGRVPQATCPPGTLLVRKGTPGGRHVSPACCWLAEYPELSGRRSSSWGQRGDCTSHGTPAVPGGGDEAVLLGESLRGGYPRWLAKLHTWTWPVGQHRVCIGCKTEQESFLTLHSPEWEN